MHQVLPLLPSPTEVKILESHGNPLDGLLFSPEKDAIFNFCTLQKIAPPRLAQPLFNEFKIFNAAIELSLYAFSAITFYRKTFLILFMLLYKSFGFSPSTHRS